MFVLKASIRTVPEAKQFFMNYAVFVQRVLMLTCSEAEEFVMWRVIA
jgi:hypothetical protein